MGEAKKRRNAQKQRLASASCVYCAGLRTATTIDHMPPRAIFDRKHRPRGLEFPSCEVCNAGTRLTDQVAAMISRIQTGDLDQERAAEFKKYLGGVFNNEAGLLEELEGSPEWRRSAATRAPPGQHAIYVGGPLVSRHMEAFAAKFGFAMHAERMGEPLPAGGAIAARWFSNADALEGRLPGELWSVLEEPKTLRQGSFQVADQFEYSWAATEDGSAGMFIGAFRRAFAVVAFSARSAETFKDRPAAAKLWTPGSLAGP